MVQHNECVFIGKYKTTFLFKVEGRLTQKSLRNVNTAVQKCTEDTTITDILVDLTQCSYMDSTILGILARWAISFTKTHDSLPFLIGLEGSPLEAIFRRMNLTTLFHVSQHADTFKQETLLQLSLSEQYSTREYARYILSAHETLAELSPANAKEFAAVIQCLKAEITTE